MAFTFDQVKKGYGNLWDQAQLKDKFHSVAMQTAKRVMDHEDVFKQVEEETDVPWFMIGVWLYRESNIDLNTYLGNGQSLHRVTTEVPEGRGPFPSFLAGAIDALKLEGLYKLGKAAWNLEFCLYGTEKLNGFGYFSHGVNSPYLWSWTTLYTHGKFTSDHGFDPDFTDPQGGVAAILMALFEIDPTLMPARVAKQGKPTMTTTTAPTVSTAHGVDIGAVVHGLESVLSFAPTLAMVFPPLQPIVPFIPIIKGALSLVDELPTVGHDPQAIIDLILKHLQDVHNNLATLKGQVAPGQTQQSSGG